MYIGSSNPKASPLFPANFMIRLTRAIEQARCNVEANGVFFLDNRDIVIYALY
jgi:hypothetical protein